MRDLLAIFLGCVTFVGIVVFYAYLWRFMPNQCGWIERDMAVCGRAP